MSSEGGRAARGSGMKGWIRPYLTWPRPLKSDPANQPVLPLSYRSPVLLSCHCRRLINPLYTQKRSFFEYHKDSFMISSCGITPGAVKCGWGLPFACQAASDFERTTPLARALHELPDHAVASQPTHEVGAG